MFYFNLLPDDVVKTILIKEVEGKAYMTRLQEVPERIMSFYKDHLFTEKRLEVFGMPQEPRLNKAPIELLGKVFDLCMIDPSLPVMLINDNEEDVVKATMQCLWKYRPFKPCDSLEFYLFKHSPTLYVKMFSSCYCKFGDKDLSEYIITYIPYLEYVADNPKHLSKVFDEALKERDPWLVHNLASSLSGFYVKQVFPSVNGQNVREITFVLDNNHDELLLRIANILDNEGKKRRILQLRNLAFVIMNRSKEGTKNLEEIKRDINYHSQTGTYIQTDTGLYRLYYTYYGTRNPKLPREIRSDLKNTLIPYYQGKDFDDMMLENTSRHAIILPTMPLEMLKEKFPSFESLTGDGPFGNLNRDLAYFFMAFGIFEKDSLHEYAIWEQDPLNISFLLELEDYDPSTEDNTLMLSSLDIYISKGGSKFSIDSVWINKCKVIAKDPRYDMTIHDMDIRVILKRFKLREAYRKYLKIAPTIKFIEVWNAPKKIIKQLRQIAKEEREHRHKVEDGVFRYLTYDAKDGFLNNPLNDKQIDYIIGNKKKLIKEKTYHWVACSGDIAVGYFAIIPDYKKKYYITRILTKGEYLSILDDEFMETVTPLFDENIESLHFFTRYREESFLNRIGQDI